MRLWTGGLVGVRVLPRLRSQNKDAVATTAYERISEGSRNGLARKPIPHDGAVFCVADVINAYLAQTERISAMKTRYTIEVDHYNGSAVMRVEELCNSVAGECAFNKEVRLLNRVKVNFECGTSEVLSPPDSMGVRYPKKKANGDIYLSFGGWLSDVVPTKEAA